MAVPAETDRWWVTEEMKDSDTWSDTDDNGSAVKRDQTAQNGGIEPFISIKFIKFIYGVLLRQDSFQLYSSK